MIRNAWAFTCEKSFPDIGKRKVSQDTPTIPSVTGQQIYFLIRHHSKTIVTTPIFQEMKNKFLLRCQVPRNVCQAHTPTHSIGGRVTLSSLFFSFDFSTTVVPTYHVVVFRYKPFLDIIITSSNWFNLPTSETATTRAVSTLETGRRSFFVFVVMVGHFREKGETPLPVSKTRG